VVIIWQSILFKLFYFARWEEELFYPVRRNRLDKKELTKEKELNAQKIMKSKLPGNFGELELEPKREQRTKLHIIKMNQVASAYLDLEMIILQRNPKVP
jgi:hypothetical protein